MTQSVQNFDNRNRYAVPPVPAQTQRAVPNQAVRIPDYYVQDDKQGFKEILENNPMYSTGIKGFFGPLIDHPIASILTWFGCGYLLDKYTSSCGGEYDKSLLKKVVNFGDNIQNSKFIQSKPVQSFLGLFKKGKASGGKIIEKNSVLNAIWKTPTMPEWEIVKSEMIPQRQRVVHDFNLIANELKLASDGFAPLHKLAVDKSEKAEMLKAFKVAKLSEIPEELASSFVQLKRLGKSEEFITNTLAMPDGGVATTKAEILRAMGNKNADWIKAVHEDTIGKYISEVQEATKNVGNKVRISLGDFKPMGINLGVLTTPTKRIVGCDNIHNRLYSLDGGAKTATGRFMSRFMQMVHRGLTFGGGKLGVLLFIAPAFVETAINVHKAEPSQKVGTGVSNLTNHISWVFTFPFALQIMHHICGAQYAGMKKEDIQAIRKLQSDFNKKNKLNGTAEGFADHEAYNKRRKIVNEEIKAKKVVKGQKWYTKAIRKLAGILTPDLGKLDAYNTGNAITTKISQLRNLPRNLVGVPLRLILFGVLTMGVLDSIINKTIKFCFGDSYDSMKEEEIKDSKKEQKKFLKEDLNDRLYQTQKQKLAAMAIKQQPDQQQISKPQGQALSHRGAGENSYAIPQIQPQQITKENIDTYNYIPSQKNTIKQPVRKGSNDTYSYIPSQDSTIKQDKNGNINSSTVRSYIPSQAGAHIDKSWDNSHLQSALDRAQRAEDRAYKVLSGNFEGMI